MKPVFRIQEPELFGTHQKLRYVFACFGYACLMVAMLDSVGCTRQQAEYAETPEECLAPKLVEIEKAYAKELLSSCKGAEWEDCAVREEITAKYDQQRSSAIAECDK